MVRKDKITYLITHFNSSGTDYPYPDETFHECMIKTILSQNTSDLNRDRAYESLSAKCSDIYSIYNTSTNDIEKIIKVGGLAHQKSLSIKNFADWCMENDDICKNMPKMKNEDIISLLISIKGVGLKTICIYLSFCLKRDIIPIDVHVNRIFTRIGVVNKKMNADKLFSYVNPYVPIGRHYYLHMNLIDFGRSVCKAKSPQCTLCELNTHCDFYNKKNYWLEEVN